MTTYTAKAMHWLTDGKTHTVIYYVHEQATPIKIVMGPQQRRMIEKQMEETAPVEMPCA